MAVKKGRGQEKLRNTANRRPKRIILIAAEGTNKTETNYFKGIRSDAVRFLFTSGNETDPVKLMNRLLKEFGELGLEEDDLAFSLVDGDVNPSKDSQIAEADKLAKDTSAKQIVSNPCFEVWYLDHFRFTTKQFRSSAEVETALAAEFPGYSKSRPDMYEQTKDKLQTAVANAKRQEQRCKEAGNKPHTSAFQPSTEVYRIMEAIQEIESSK